MEAKFAALYEGTKYSTYCGNLTYQVNKRNEVAHHERTERNTPHHERLVLEHGEVEYGVFLLFHGLAFFAFFGPRYSVEKSCKDTHAHEPCQDPYGVGPAKVLYKYPPHQRPHGNGPYATSGGDDSVRQTNPSETERKRKGMKNGRLPGKKERKIGIEGRMSD